MKLLRRWPAIVERDHFVWLRTAYVVFTLVWCGVLAHLFLNWDAVGWAYRGVVLALLILFSPSLPEMFQSYESYRRDQERFFGDATEKTARSIRVDSDRSE